MANIEIVDVESSAQLKEFIRYPNILYKADANYVAPLYVERKEFFDLNKNPFYKTSKVKLFLAKRNGETVGRIAACINYAHNQFHEDNTGFFGFFDCPDDFEIASTLLKVVMITLKREGMNLMMGPMNFSTNHECGFLVEGFDSPPKIMMTYNPPYLPKLAEKFGMKKSMDLLAMKLFTDKPVPERIQKVVERTKRNSELNVRTINMSDFENELDRVMEVYNKAWQHNWGFVPMSDAEFRYTAKDLKQVIDPRMVFMVEHKNQPIAFSLALPDINQALIKLKGKLFPFGLLKLIWHTKIINKVNELRLITFGVIPEYQKRGVDMLLFEATYKAGYKHGYKWGELSWVLESNELMIRGTEQMGAFPYKRYRVVEIPL